ncbi:hypothetical protein B1C78_12855 [Thioalkalivibrio denitrificans]|uniref:Sulfotransferase n=1 Tax=Thioalkalivibrio denitrificans TaxID=108003 RepID=A0A1V3ND66_9GAMM|nr:sulfotransferase family protein [Thioalkalivibrio denitrificans]OOG23010.1 hypothetical protein B1C78_12855 [Thioalkalivibrio denitrificans]
MIDPLQKLRIHLRNRRLRRHPLAAECHPQISVGFVFARALVSESHRFCYFRLPKCANSTVVNTLAWYDPEVETRPDDGAARAAKRSYGRLDAARAATLDELQQRYFLFTFVRNPYTRLLSSYLDKGLQKDPRQSFADFIARLERGGLHENAHWAPQTAMLPVRPERLAFIGRTERIEEDLKTVVDRIFGQGTFQAPRNREVNRKGAADKLARYYSDGLAERVHALYADDFAAFDYPSQLDQV